MSTDPRQNDEATLIAMRYALADVLELCGSLSPASRADAQVIEHIVGAASLQVMLLMKMQSCEQPAATPASLSTAA